MLNLTYFVLTEGKFLSEILNASQISPKDFASNGFTKLTFKFFYTYPLPPTPVEVPQLQASISHSSAKYFFFRQIAHHRCCREADVVNLQLNGK